MSLPPLEFVLIDTRGALCAEWKEEFGKLPEDVRAHFTFVQSRLDELPAPHNKFDCAVSPANSYGLMDGGCAFVTGRRGSILT
jgi:hypothetical protein